MYKYQDRNKYDLNTICILIKYFTYTNQFAEVNKCYILYNPLQENTKINIKILSSEREKDSKKCTTK